jgi:hypothetical protein
MKITDIEFKDSKAYYNDVELTDEILDNYYKHVDYEDEKIGKVLLKIYNYGKLPNRNDLSLYMTAKSLASLLRCNIIEDRTLPAESFDQYFVGQHDAIRNMFNVNIEYVNPYDMDFDSTKLVKGENGSYSFNGVTCIEPNNKTTYFFRDFLILFNSEVNILYLSAGGYDEDTLDKLFQSHQFEVVEWGGNDNAEDVLVELSHPKYGFSQLSNQYLVYLLDESFVNQDKILDILSTKDINLGRYSDENKYLNLVELKAVKTKQPRLLFNELMSLNNPADIQHGLLRLGFNLIE